MKLIVFEGYNDLQFFRSFFTKVIKAKIITSKEKNLVDMFRNLVSNNPEMARVEVLLWGNEKLLLLSVGGKDNFKLIAEGLRPLVNIIKRERKEDIKDVAFIADEDAKSVVETSLKSLNHLNLQIKTIFYRNYLEDLILSVINFITLDKDILETIQSIMEIIDKKFKYDKDIKKRKVGIIHAIIGPRCFRHMFDEIFVKIPSQEEIQKLEVFKELINWLVY